LRFGEERIASECRSDRRHSPSRHSQIASHELVKRLCARAGAAYLAGMSASLNADPARPVFFERVLWPHRSLPPRGFRLLMLGLGLLSLAASIAFVAAGAWPVCGFFGLDVALLYLAFRLSYRSARQRETLRLADDQFTVERVDVYGERRLWRFQPFWLRIVLEERHDESNRLLLASHGKSLVIGDFLAPALRRDLAAALRDALMRWRAALNPASMR
jgi:uncharacterized membrane protein